MKISLNWLQEFIDLTEHDIQKINDRVTTAMGEVDDIEEQGKYLAHCVVGRVTNLRKHPGADKLSLCDVETDQGKKKVVCGGSNLYEGMCVAFAHVGATVKWHGGDVMTLTKAKIRGEESEGMVCAAEELDLVDLFPRKAGEDDHAVVDLGERKDVGTPLKKALGLDDVTLYIDNHAITHRADLFSHLGVAREFVAMGLGKWKKKSKATALKFPKQKVSFKFIVKDQKIMPSYAACMLEIDSLGETPNWMKTKLAAIGVRSVSLPVDITNFVASELGVPLHSFDADDLKGDVRVELSNKGEKLTTLDHVERSLPDGAIILRDDLGVFDLMGIMGGLRSSTKPTTKRIYLHAPRVDPPTIRKTIIATGLRTDAATVYEKGVPHSMVAPAVLRAAELMLELIPGAKLVSELSEYGSVVKTPTIELSLLETEATLGQKISEKEAADILGNLDFVVKKKKKSKTDTVLSVSVPSHRLGDIRTSYDLIEEVARIYGYNEIPAQMPKGDLTPPHRDHRVQMIRQALKEDGFTELLPLSLTSKTVLEKAGVDTHSAVSIDNPLGEELGTLQTHTLPALLEHAARNIAEVSGGLQTFHWGHVFSKKIPEHTELTLLCMPARGENPKLNALPVLIAKSALIHALGTIGISAEVSQNAEASLPGHPGRAGTVKVHGKEVGSVYEIHPEVLQRFDLPARTAAVTIDLSMLLKETSTVKVPTPLPAFPPVSYDETLPMSTKSELGPLLHDIQHRTPLLAEIKIIDLYEGSPTDRRVSIRCTYRSPERTLTEAEVKAEHEGVLATLRNHLS